jgi:hypothetical protein
MFLLPLKTQSAVAPPIFLRALIEGTRQFEVGPAAQLFQGKPARFSERTGSLILKETELRQQFDIGEDPVESSVQIGNCLEDTNTFREWLGGFGGGRFRGTLSYAARAASAGDSHDLPPFSWRGRGRVDAFNSGALRVSGCRDSYRGADAHERCFPFVSRVIAGEMDLYVRGLI